MYALLPFALFIISFVFWTVYKIIARSNSYPFGRAIATLIVTLFLIHPNIVQYTFKDFKCVDVDGENRLLDDLQITCWNNAHSTMTYFVALPSLFVWGLGIPFFMLLGLIKLKKHIDII